MDMLENIMQTEVQLKHRVCHKYLWSERVEHSSIIFEKQQEIASSGHLDIWQHKIF